MTEIFAVNSPLLLKTAVSLDDCRTAHGQIRQRRDANIQTPYKRVSCNLFPGRKVYDSPNMKVY